MEVKYNNGLVLNGQKLSLSAVLLVFGIITFTSGQAIFGSLLVSTWVILLFWVKGVIVHFDNKTIHVYSAIFGIKFGEVRPSSDFPFYRIKKIVSEHRAYRRGSTNSSIRLQQLGIVIYDKKYKKEVLLRKGNRKVLEQIATKLNNQLGTVRK